MKQIAFLLFALLAVSPSFAQDGPFGISMGDAPEQHECVLYNDENLYECRKIAKPHPDIEDYMVYLSEETGIVMIRASGYIQENDVYGSAIMEFIDKIGELQRMLDKSDYRQGFAGLIPGLRSAWSKIARAMFSGISIVTTRSPSAGLGCS